ncbi:MAG: hypothetical protein JNK82_08005 [Myxococcaceae bacterium]|nr:hypothetical protein [Myxococcaceae bacterium]
MFRVSLVAVLSFTGAAYAQERVRCAVHPISAPGVDDAKLVGELNREAQNILAETKRVTLVAPEDVEKRLAEEGGKCPARGKERTDCLERIALATRAVYAIAVTVKRLGKDYELSATIADADRVLLEQPESLTVTVTDPGGGKVEIVLKQQLRVLLIDRLKAGQLPSDPRMRNPEKPGLPIEPPPPMPPLETAKPAPGLSTMKMGAIIAGGFAVVAGGVAIGLGASASSDASGLNVGSDGVLQDPSQVSKVSSSRNKASIAAAMGGVAGAAAVAAIVMFLLPQAEDATSAAKTTVAPTVFNGGGGFAISGSLP